VEDIVGDQVVDAIAELEGGVDLEERPRPQVTTPQLALDQRGDVRVADVQKAANVGLVVIQDLISQGEDVHEDGILPPRPGDHNRSLTTRGVERSRQ